MSRQEVFALFYAIFWATVTAAWPKWKAFHWTFFFDSERVATRVIWSMLMLNIIPVIFFGEVFLYLNDSHVTTWHDILQTVIPPFSVFGFYRLWIAGLEFAPERFYYGDDQEARCPILKDIDPPIGKLGLRADLWLRDLVFGLIYVLVGVSAVLFNRV